MKKSVYIATSMDGFIARENGDLDWLPGSEGSTTDEDYGYHKFFDSVDVLIMGRNTFEKVLSFGEWPYSEKKVIVLSHTRKQIPADISRNVEMKSGSPDKIIKGLEGQGYKHTYIDGGKTIQDFLHAGHIDEMIITRVPVMLGKGIPLFGAHDEIINLSLLKVTPFSNGLVQTHYNLSR